MAIYTITSINYIVGGKTEKFINLDLMLADNNESTIKNITLLTDNSEKPFTDDTLKNTGNTSRLLLDEDNYPNHIYALFDFKDVAVKSDFYQNDKSSVFGPILHANPLGFAQGTNANIYGATSIEISSSTIIAKTNLADDRSKRLGGLTNSLNWQYELSSTGNLTYSGEYLKNYTIESDEIDEETGRPKQVAAKSLYEYVSSFSDKTAGIEQVLKPKYQDTNVQKNYLYQIFGSNKKSSRDKWNEFNSGNIFGNVFGAKNFYDAEYSTAAKLDNTDQLQFPVRNYLRIGATGGRPFLTYKTEDDWKQYDTSGKNGDLVIQNGNNIAKTTSTLPRYDHVETIDSINRFLNRSNHKSNMYSIRLNLGLENLANNTVVGDDTMDKQAKVAKLLNNVKLDIQNNVRKIAEELAPAHTQLFKVYIDEN